MRWRVLTPMKGLLAAATVVALGAVAALGDEGDAGLPQAVKQVTAVRINPERPHVDGLLDDAMWQETTFATGFSQRDPVEFDRAHNGTEFAICYDDDALYIAARMQSLDPVMSAVTRRDNIANSECIIVSLDTYENKRTAYTFVVTATGVRSDFYHGSDDYEDRDYEWDPVWEAAARRRADGWTMEMRIPLSQLRFQRKAELAWGINVNRWVPTANEDSYWVLVPKNETGWSSRMGRVVGIENIAPSRRIEFLPYVTGNLRRDDSIDEADPFRDVNDYSARAGGDLKVGVGPNLTLTGAINPDFGQVEADPAVVNLTAFETIFEERRPFFTEGSDLLSGDGPNYFYSRRIGASPWGFATGTDTGTYSHVPNSTSIIGAAKLTGRTNNGLNIGLLGAVTSEETGDIYDQGTDSFEEQQVQPRTVYGTARLQQEFGRDASTVGVIFTGVERDLDDSPIADELRRRAIAGGVDFNLRFAGGKYVVGGDTGASYIDGNESVMTAAQLSSARYYQRPDADYVDVDTTRTDLTGWVGNLRVEKLAGQHWLWGMGAGAVSPGFELNDAGRLQTADDVDGWGWLRYRENEAGSLFHDWWIQSRSDSRWNFGGVRNWTTVDVEGNATFTNFVGTNLLYHAMVGGLSDDFLRGGPLIKASPSWSIENAWWSGDNRRTSWRLWGKHWKSDLGSWSYHVEGSVTVRPWDRLQLSLNSRWDHSMFALYIGREGGGPPETFGDRHIISFIDLDELRLGARVDLAITPDLSLEFYAEPFNSSGRYHDFSELIAARTTDLRYYGRVPGTSITDNGDGTYTVTDGADTFAINRPDFNLVSFRSNFVLRWEWLPGSTFFFVWQQNSGELSPVFETVRPANLFDALQADGESFVAIKISYWIPFL